MAKAGDHAREAPLQRALGHPHGSYERLQLALHRLLGRRVRSPGKPLLRRTGLHYPPRHRARHLRVHLHRRRAARAQAGSHRALRSAFRLLVPLVHQRDAHRRRVLPRFAAREELHPRHQRGRLRGSNRWTPRRGHVPKGRPGNAPAQTARAPLRRLVLLHVSQRRFHRLRGVLRLDDRPGRPIRLDIHLHARRRGRARRTHGASRPARTPLPLRPRDAQQETHVHLRFPKRWRVRGRMHRRRR